MSATLFFPLLTVSVPPAAVPEKEAAIFPCFHARSARSRASVRLKPERYPVNGAVRLWSSLSVPVAPTANATLSESAPANSTLPLPDSVNDPLPLTAALRMAVEAFAMVKVSDPVIAPLKVAAAPFWTTTAPAPLMLPAKLLLAETVSDPLSTIAYGRPV